MFCESIKKRINYLNILINSYSSENSNSLRVKELVKEKEVLEYQLIEETHYR